MRQSCLPMSASARKSPLEEFNDELDLRVSKWGFRLAPRGGGGL